MDGWTDDGRMDGWSMSALDLGSLIGEYLRSSGTFSHFFDLLGGKSPKPPKSSTRLDHSWVDMTQP